MTETCEFVHIDAIGSLHTWARGGDNPMDLRLDRAICSTDWFDSWANLSCLVLPRIASDHNPLLFSSSNSSLTGPKPFRFSSPWIRHPEFLETVSNSWKKPSFAPW